MSAEGFSLYAARRCFASRRSVFVPSLWTSRPALIRWKSGGGDQEVLGALVRDRVADHLVGLLAERQPVLRLGGPGLALGVVGRPLVERDDPLPGRLDELLAELDRLGQDDLFLGGQQGDLADLLEVHPDGIVDPDHVGRERLELLGGRLLELDRVELGRGVGRQRRAGRLALDRDVDRDVLARRASTRPSGAGPSSRSASRSSSSSSSSISIGSATAAAPGLPGRFEASRASSISALRPARPGGQHRLDELLVQ